VRPTDIILARGLSSIENELQAMKLIGRKIKIVRVAIVKSRMNKRGSVINRSVVIELARNSPNIINMRKIRFTESRDMIRHNS
jgi:hypothetical protein